MAAGRRLHDLDNLRTALVVLVVLHHLGVIYSAASPFYYVEPPFTDPLAFVVIVVFALLNQAWFMGALFLIAGLFTPASFDRKGGRAFLRERAIRLGLPALAFVFVVAPLARIGLYLMPTELTGLVWPPAIAVLYGELGVGPLWFAVMLLVFDVGYAGWRALRGGGTAGERSLPGAPVVAGFVLALAAASYLIRIPLPLGKVVYIPPFFDFPTLAYLPQYLSFFVVGAIAGRSGWHDRLTGRMGLAGLGAAILATLVLFPPALTGAPFSLALDEKVLLNAFGDGTWQSAVYALWDSTFAVGLTVAAIVGFRAFFGGGGRLARFLARHSYAVFVIHVPVIILVAWLLRDTGVPTLGRLALAALIGVPVSFAVAWLVRLVPGVKRSV